MVKRLRASSRAHNKSFKPTNNRCAVICGLTPTLAAMNMRILTAALLALAATAQAAEPKLSQIPADLSLLENFGSHRILAFRSCSPEHCWNEAFIQELSQEIEPAVVCSAAVSEFNNSADVVINAVKLHSGSAPMLELNLSSAHGAFEPFTATLSVSKDCKYQLLPPSPPAANNSFKADALRARP